MMWREANIDWSMKSYSRDAGENIVGGGEGKIERGRGIISDFECSLPLVVLSRSETIFILDTFSFLEQSRTKQTGEESFSTSMPKEMIASPQQIAFTINESFADAEEVLYEIKLKALYFEACLAHVGGESCNSLSDDS